MAQTILFPFGIRLSSWAVTAAFVALAIRQRSIKPILAGWTWAWGFEAAYDASTMIVGHPLPFGYAAPAFQTAVGVATVWWMSRYGIRPSRTVMAVVAAVWLFWAATGFNSNLHTVIGLDPVGEAFNEAAKTLWAVAYLLPFSAPRYAWPRARRFASVD